MDDKLPADSGGRRKGSHYTVFVTVHCGPNGRIAYVKPEGPSFDRSTFGVYIRDLESIDRYLLHLDAAYTAGREAAKAELRKALGL